MRDNPENVIPPENMGSDAQCQLASVTAAPKPTITDDDSSDSAASFPWALMSTIFILGIAVLY
jgi:hypothetical protein